MSERTCPECRGSGYQLRTCGDACRDRGRCVEPEEACGREICPGCGGEGETSAAPWLTCPACGEAACVASSYEPGDETSCLTCDAVVQVVERSGGLVLEEAAPW